MKKPQTELARWGVYMLRKKATWRGTVEAKDQDEALKKAAEVFHVRVSDRWRISVQRE
jgi:hypothetical protein